MGIKVKNNFHIENRMKAAMEYEVQGKLLHAVQIFRSIIEEAPEHLEAYYCLANLYEQSDNVDSGVELLEQLLEIDPIDKNRRLYLAQYLLHNTQWNKAIEVLSYFSPEEEPLAAFFLGCSYFMMKDYEIAKLNFLTFVSNKNESDLNHEAFLYLTKIDLELNNYETALNFAKRAEPVYFNYWEFSFLMAKIYYKMGMFEHAIKPIEKSIKQNQKQPEVYELAGNIYLRAGQYLKAEKNLLKFSELSGETSPEFYVGLAKVCLKADKAKDALKYYEKAIQLDPENDTAIAGINSAKTILNNNVVNDG
jgi:tetratricopeptide (TPR) repeat protein